ncbi:P-loop containing nucleoside triphosphate hydrolase protein [Lactarius vividus]|nr:P-loop containing nucleoside triphosphate hydrolase protein [Lactarius vividus]
MTLQVVLPPQISLMTGGTSSKKSVVKAKAFFEMCINLQAPADAGSSNGTQRPRLIYIRDFSTLSSSWATLHPVLLSAVRQRRQGVLSRPTSPVINPTTIIFGITPPIFPSTSAHSSPPPGPHDMVNVLTSTGQAGPGVASPRYEKSDWSEEGHAEKARERRLRERLRKWERGDSSLQSEIPKLVTTTPVEEEPGPNQPNFAFIGGPGGANPFTSFLNPLLSGHRPSPQSETPNSNPSTNSGFLRTSVVVPASRSLLHEKTSRVGRRREINELTMRMAIGEIGGLLEARSAVSVFTPSSELAPSPLESVTPENTSNATRMWEDWGNRITAWAQVKLIADQAVGRVVSSSLRGGEMVKPSLSAAPVLWEHVCGAWANRSTGGQQAWDDETEPEVDDIVESVRHEPSLDMHEQRLVGCIVDSASMPTSFAHVHLPAHTIDSVRTIVSLPMLHPTAFQQGILKEHSMSGCLLFGPPGTGKTLVVRALAREAGCRMLAISPSDVMDMYVGEAEKLVRSVFKLARRLAPCVVFIDEIDALFGARSSSSSSGGGSAHRAVITEFMQEMDGLKTFNAHNVIVIGATNRPFDLDDAVLRRLPRRLLVDLPGENEREEILKILLRNETLSPNVDLKALARDTPTFSGSDLKHACVSAALDAVKEKVSVPWVVDRGKNDHQDTLQMSNTERKENTPPTFDDSESATQRVLRPHNFAKALKEITPSASESLGSLSDLRKWNDEFGEGRKRKKQVWGRDRFGFTKQWHTRQDGRVATPTGSDESNSTPSAG